MNYYYDVILNFADNNLLFYEWDEKDSFDYIEKIPIYRISETDMIIITENVFKINEYFLKEIRNKTTIHTKSLIKSIEYACLFTDTKNVIAVEFNSKGESISFSNLLLEDDLNVLEMSYTLKKKKIDYDVIKSRKINGELRELTKIKKTIKNEISLLYNEKNTLKLTYLFFEWFNYKEKNFENMYKMMREELNKEVDSNQYKIYKIIKLSYSNV